MTVLFQTAPAKLNLVLRIVGRRADGYHLLESLFHPIALADELWVGATAPATGVALTVASAGERSAVAAADNLVVRALERLRAAASNSASGRAVPGFEAHLRKRIPVGGGLGGGSSDAATALALGNALLDRPLAAATLHELAVGLGADVPFFLLGGSAWGCGIGDELTPVDAPSWHFVLLVPPFDCPTVAVYKNHAAHWNDGAPQGTSGSQPLPTTRESVLRIEFSNDLTAAAESVRPELAALRQRASELAGVPAHVTGSGSTLFLASRTAADAAVIRERLAPLAADGVEIVRTQSAGPPMPPTEAAAVGGACGGNPSGRGLSR
ncbi:MAG: 4-(cytidine 5'-diphospho)-2-C-methyl-D-erythritol kinase [bacterium]|nr:4-(cytidine 5'-diphospho)-2-C-methyl-D-erythritol kinase [bacterium]